MDELVIFGDIEEALIDTLTTMLTDNSRPCLVCGSVPTDRPSEFVVVQRLGGPRFNLIADKPLITFESWANSPSSALSLAQLVRALVFSLKGTTIDAMTIYRVNEVAGPALLPDPESKQARYVSTSELFVRALNN